MGFFPQAFAVILHWNKSQNSQNSPLTGTPEECHLRILFQKEVKFQGGITGKFGGGSSLNDFVA